MASPQKTENDNDYNKADNDYKNKFRNLSEREKNPPKSSQNNNLDKYSEEEGRQPVSPGGLYKPSFQSSNGKNRFSPAGIKMGAKKGGPIAAIISISIIALVALFSPAGLIVFLKETMVGKFNQQLKSMDARTMLMIKAKTSQATKGVCNGLVKIKCKYSTMSEKQLKKFQAAGFEIESERTAFGRNSVKAIKYKGETIKPEDFRSRMINDPEFRRAVRVAYNPKFAGFADKVWTKIKLKFNINERAPKTAKSVDDRKTALHDNSKNPFPDTSLKNKYPEENKPHPLCDDPQSCTKNEAADLELRNKIDEQYTQANKFFSPERKFTPGKLLGTATRGVGLVGAVDTACSAYIAIQLTAFAAKHIRALQLARYAVQYFTVADMIKAGDAKPEDVSQLGTILTSNSPGSYSDTDKGPRKSATDSFGYKYAAYGDTKMKSDQTALFIAGGGLTGTLVGFSRAVTNVLGGKDNIHKTCKVVKNPYVQVGSLITGIAFTLIPGFGWGKAALQVAFAAAVGVTTAMLPGILADIIAGNVTEGIQGEDSGDAITSGAGALMGSLANAGGNAPLTIDQAKAYNKLNQETTVAYLKDEASQLSPLDISNKYTFMGSIFSSLVPYYSKQAFSFSGAINTALSIVGSSFASIIPKSSAVSDEQMNAAMEVCQDYDYKDMKIATDPFCNPMFGIPPNYLEVDPFEVLDYLLSNKYIDEEGNKTSEYEKWISKCTERKYPFGFADDQGTEDGSDCIIKDEDKEVAYLYLGIIDSRIEEGMDGYDILGDPTAYNAEDAIDTTLGDFVFPLDTSQEKIINYKPLSWWCWNKSTATCHGTESYGYYAADIFVAPGTPVRSATAGTVVKVNSEDKELSITIKGNDCGDGSQVCNGKGSVFFYTHMKPGSEQVEGGQIVTAGTIIGNIGDSSNTGNGSTEHLHFDVSDRKNSGRLACSRKTPDECEKIGFINIQPQLFESFKMLPVK